MINLNVKESAKARAKRKHRSFIFCDFSRGTESWQVDRSWLESWIEGVTTGQNYIKSSVDSYHCVLPVENNGRAIALDKLDKLDGPDNREAVEDRIIMCRALLNLQHDELN